MTEEDLKVVAEWLHQVESRNNPRIAYLQERIDFYAAAQPPGWRAKIRELQQQIDSERLDY